MAKMITFEAELASDNDIAVLINLLHKATGECCLNQVRRFGGQATYSVDQDQGESKLPPSVALTFQLLRKVRRAVPRSNQLAAYSTLNPETCRADRGFRN